MKKLARFAILCLTGLLVLPLGASGAPAAGAGVGGLVTGADGAPLAGARVSLVPVQSSYEWGRMVLSGRSQPEAAAAAQSDAAGRYQLISPSIGLWMVVVEAPGHVPVQSPALTLLEPAELPPAILLRDAGTRLEVRTAAGAPAAGAWVYASSETPGVWKATDTAGWTVRPRFAAAGADGRLTLPRAGGERLRVTLLATGGVRTEKAGIEGAGSVVLDADAADAAGTAGDASRVLEVRSAEGRPVAGVQVRLDGLPVPAGATDDQGRLSLALPARGPLKIRLLAADGRRHNTLMEREGAGGPSVAVASLPASAILSGRVLDSVTRKPLPGALVWSTVDPGAFSVADAAGRYRVVPAVGERSRLQAEAAGHLPLVHRFDWRPGSPLRAPALALDPAVAVAGQVVDSQGKPAPGVLVQAVLRSGLRQRQYSRTGTAERATSTGTDGRFRLDKLLAGETWEVRALRPGFAAARLTLPALRSRSDLRLVLEKGRNGFGRVVDRSEQPVREAEVLLLASTGKESLRSERRALGEKGIDSWTAASDAAGRFDVPALPPGPVDLLVRKGGYAPVLIRAVPVPRGEGPFDLGTVILEAAVEIRGRVTDREGKPVAGAEIHATRDLRRVRAEAENGSPERKPEAVTGADGRFAIPDLRRGDRLDLFARAQGFLPGEVEGVSAPTATAASLVLDRAARLSGRVVDAEGQPIVGASLDLSTDRPGEERGLVRSTGRSDTSTTSEEDGRFAFEGVRPGRARLRASAPGFQEALLEELEVPAGKPVENVKVVMERGAVIEGRVLTSAGEPVGDARVIADSAAAVSDAEGAYRLDGVPPGPRTVQAQHQDFPPLERRIEVEPLSPNQLDLVFEAGHEVSGRVVDREGKGVEGAQVSLARAGSPRERHAVAGADGSFTVPHLLDGEYSLRAEREGYATTEIPDAATVAGSSVRDVEVRLTRGGKIAGRLLGLDLYDLAEVTVRARREDGFEKPGRVDYAGRYSVEELPAGDWLVLGSLRDGSREAQARTALEPGGEDSDVDLEFGGNLALSGRVLLGGEPLKGARVSLAGQDVAVQRMVESDWDGLFRVEDVKPGRYRLQVTARREMASHSEDLALDSDREVVIDLGSTRFSGTVVDESTSEGLPGAVVALRRLEGEEAAFLVTMGTDAEGYFALPHVTEGSYRVTVTKDGYSPWDQAMQIQAGAPLQDQRIPLSPTRGLDLAPGLASGRRPPHVSAALLDGAGRILLFEARAVDASGVARFPTAPAGEWDLLVSAPGGALTEARVKVPGDPVPVVLPDAGRLTVRVPQLAGSDAVALLTLTDAQGRPFRNLSPYGAVQSQWQVVGGKAVVEGVPAGAWTLQAVAPDGRTWSGTAVTAGAGAAGAADTEAGLN